MKEDGTPFKMVFDSIFDTIKVANTPSTITPVIVSVAMKLCRRLLAAPAINMVVIAMSVGNLPLQGTRKFVIIAINLSLGESIILQPMTPAALHPKPMHIVNACLP